MGAFHPKEILEQAQLAENSGRVREASAGYSSLALYLRQKGKLPESRKLLKRAIRLSPKSARLYAQLALAEALIGDFSAAATAVENFTQCALDRRKTDAYRPYLDSALADYPELKQIFYDKLVALDRTDASLFLEQARLWCEQGKWPQALASALQALVTKQDDASALEWIERVLHESARTDEMKLVEEFSQGRIAREDLVAALTFERKNAPPVSRVAAAESPPPLPEVESSLPGTLAGTGHHEERALQTMIRDLEREIGIEEETPDTVTPLVREFRRRSRPILQNDSKSRIDLAWAFHEMGLSTDAIDELSSIDSSDRFFAEAQVTLGEVMIAQGSDLGALDAFQNSLRDERANEDIRKAARYRMIQIFLRLGDAAQAKVEADALESIDPDYRDLRGLRHTISESLARVGGA